MLRFILSIDALRRSRAILPSWNGVIGVRRITKTGFGAAQFNEECALWPEVFLNGKGASFGDPHSLYLSFEML